MDRRSWLLLEAQDPRWMLPTDLARRDPFGARDIGWVEQMRPFIAHFAPPEGVVLDPFAGFATTLVAAALEGRRGIGFELDAGRAALARGRLARLALSPAPTVQDGALPRAPSEQRASVDLLLTSVPYFGADARLVDQPEQLYRSACYAQHLDGLGEVFHRARDWLRPGGWCIAMAQTLRLGDSVLPLAWDLAAVLNSLFQRLDERLLLYPKPAETPAPGDARSDRSHEYALVFRKAAEPLRIDSVLPWLQRWVDEGRRFAIHGSFATHWRDASAPAPHDLDLLFDPADGDLDAVVAQLAAAGFRFSSWGRPICPPIDWAALHGRCAVRAEHIDRAGCCIRIDLGFEHDDRHIRQALAHATRLRGLPLLAASPRI
jgi:hypothetical protein